MRRIFLAALVLALAGCAATNSAGPAPAAGGNPSATTQGELSRALVSPPSNPLGRCVYNNATPEEGDALVEWWLTGLSVSSPVNKYLTFTPEQKASLAQKATDAFFRILNGVCRPYAVDALRSDGKQDFFIDLLYLEARVAHERIDPALVTGSSHLTHLPPYQAALQKLRAEAARP